MSRSAVSPRPCWLPCSPGLKNRLAKGLVKGTRGEASIVWSEHPHLVVAPDLAEQPIQQPGIDRFLLPELARAGMV